MGAGASGQGGGEGEAHPQESGHGAAQEHRTAATNVQAVNAFNKAGEDSKARGSSNDRPPEKSSAPPPPPPPPAEKDKKQAQKEEDDDDDAAWLREKERLRARVKEKREKDERDRAEKSKQGGDDEVNNTSGNSKTGPPTQQKSDPTSPGSPAGGAAGGGGGGSTAAGKDATASGDKPKKKLLNGTNIEYKYPSGSSYVGGFKDGKLHGFGKYKYHPSGDIYEGEWLADMKHGQGTYTYEGGDRYTGEWRAGKKHGKGTYIFQTGDEYVGSWKEDKIHGHGVFTIARNGNRYEGNWEESYRHGHGVLRSGNGDLYEGNWVRGKEEGLGVLTYRNGNIYVGDWRSGQMDGKGIMFESGQKYVVEHIAGYAISKVPIDMEATVDPDWNSANRLFESHMKKKSGGSSPTAGGSNGASGPIENHDAYVKLKLERDMFEKKYNDLLNRRSADDDFDDEDDSIDALRTKLQRAKEQRDMEKIRADDSIAKEKVLVAEIQELKFKLEELDTLKSENQRLKQGGGGGGADSAEYEKLQRKCAELERQVQLSRQKGSAEGLDPLELKAKLELQESEMKSLKAAREELKKVREQALDNQRTIMALETRNEELLKEINVQRQRASNLHSQLNDAQVSGDQAAELKALRKELEDAKAANETLEKRVKKSKDQEKLLEERTRRTEELEVELMKLRQSKQTGEAITYKTLDKKSEELDRLREKNAELQRKLEEMGGEGETPSPGKEKKKKKKKGDAAPEESDGLNAEELNVKLEGLQNDLKKEKKKLKKVTAERDLYEQQLLVDQANLRKVQRQLSVSHGKIMVYALVRPMLQFELDRGDNPVIGPGEIAGTITNRATQDTMSFDEVFAETASGADLFAEAQPTVRKVIEGSHAALVSYGPMEGGKTFYSSQMAPLAIEELYSSIKSSGMNVKVTCTAIEITAEGINDLNSSSPSSSVQVRKNGYGVVKLVDATALPCPNVNDALRAYASAVNSHSKPRSHFCFFLEVQMKHPVIDSVGTGKLSIVDLAGPGELGRQQDIVTAKYVNNSNRSLGNVITALSENAKAVPYKDDPLCTVLSDCFGGNSRTHVYLHCSPSNYSATDTMHVMQLAVKASKVYNRPLRQFETRDTARLRNLVANSLSEDQARIQDYEITTYLE
jgi:hypothetical protein